MNLKKYMQQKADDPFFADLNEGDKEYCRQLEAEYPVKSTKDKRRIWVFISCAFAILVAAVIAISIIFAPHNSPLKYQGEKKADASTIADLNSDAKNFNVSLKDNTDCNIYLNYDIDSGDKLYYEMAATGFFETSKFVFVINNDYNYEFEKPAGQEQKAPLNGYEISYVSSVTSGLNNSAKYTAWIQFNTETIYITYTQTPSMGDQAFFDYVQSVIKAK
ncbi:MAG: hypothetical protein K2O67_02950 [Clostridia bacterium]|nr:hypothetical protein [Clostridia bacterium]